MSNDFPKLRVAIIPPNKIEINEISADGTISGLIWMNVKQAENIAVMLDVAIKTLKGEVKTI